MNMKGRTIYPGKVKGEAIVSKEAFSFYGGVDTKTGIIIDKNNSLYGKCIKDKIFVFPCGKGSTVGSYVIYALKKNGNAPKAIINRETETIVATGAIISAIVCVDGVDIDAIKDGDTVIVDAKEKEADLIVEK
ncbi:MAG: DUF126 domain-containing protein [Candidatus Thermoplasmatota archaeon]